MTLLQITETTDNCRYCLMCRHVCPVGHVTARETLTPHGWGLLISSVQRGLIGWNDNTIDVLYSCADCGTCRAHCVTDQPLPDAIAAARDVVAGEGLAPEIVYQLKEKFETFGNPLKEQSPEAVKGTGNTALFVGDDAAYGSPGTLEAALKLLRAAGIEPVLIGVGRSNGYVPSSLGLFAEAKTLAQANLDDLAASGARRLLVLSPGDMFAFSQLYGERLGVAMPDGVEVVEVVDVLASALADGKLAFKPAGASAPYAYVDPSHSVRVEAGRYDSARALAEAALGRARVELFWHRDRTHPVGSTALKYTQPQFANHLTWARLGDALENGARTIVTEDPATLIALGMHAERFGVRLQGLYEALAQSLAS